MYQINLMNSDGSTSPIYDQSRMNDLPVIGPKASLELNEAGSVNFTLIPGHPLYDDIMPLASYISVLDDGEEIFYGRVLQRSDPMLNGQVAFSVTGAYTFLTDSEVTPDGKDKSGNPITRKITAEAFFRWCIDQHNAEVNDPRRQFTVGIVNHSKKDKVDEYSITSWTQTKSCIESMILNVYGGFIRIRPDGNGGHYIDWLEEYETVDPQAIQIGVNLEEQTNQFDSNQLFTVIRPIGKDDIMLPEKTVDLYSAADIAKYGRIVKTIEFKSAENEADLRTQVQEYIQRMQKTLFTNSSIRMVDMHYLDGEVPKVKLGDRFTNIVGLNGEEMTAAGMELDFEHVENTTLDLKNKKSLMPDMTPEGNKHSSKKSHSKSSAKSAATALKYYHELQDQAKIDVKRLELLSSDLRIYTDGRFENVNREYIDLSLRTGSLENWKTDEATVAIAGLQFKVTEIEGTGVIKNSEHIDLVAGKFEVFDDGQGNIQVHLKDGADLSIDDASGIAQTVGTRLATDQERLDGHDIWKEAFEGSALWTQRDNITGVCGEYDVVWEYDAEGNAHKTLVIKEGGGLKIRKDGVEYGFYQVPGGLWKQVQPQGNENPKLMKWYELVPGTEDEYRLTEDTEVRDGKKYFVRSGEDAVLTGGLMVEKINEAVVTKINGNIIKIGDDNTMEVEVTATQLAQFGLVDTSTYVKVIPKAGDNPKAKGWYEKQGNNYVLTEDVEVQDGKDYFTHKFTAGMVAEKLRESGETLVTINGNHLKMGDESTVDVSITASELAEFGLVDTKNYTKVTPKSGDNPKVKGWYELVGTDYVLTNDETVQEGKDYFTHKFTAGLVVEAFDNDETGATLSADNVNIFGTKLTQAGIVDNNPDSPTYGQLTAGLIAKKLEDSDETVVTINGTHLKFGGETTVDVSITAQKLAEFGLVDTRDYVEVTPKDGDHPNQKGWYEQQGTTYVPTTDPNPVAGKKYFISNSNKGKLSAGIITELINAEDPSQGNQTTIKGDRVIIGNVGTYSGDSVEDWMQNAYHGQGVFAKYLTVRSLTAREITTLLADIGDAEIDDLNVGTIGATILTVEEGITAGSISSASVTADSLYVEVDGDDQEVKIYDAEKSEDGKTLTIYKTDGTSITFEKAASAITGLTGSWSGGTFPFTVATNPSTGYTYSIGFTNASNMHITVEKNGDPVTIPTSRKFINVPYKIVSHEGDPVTDQDRYSGSLALVDASEIWNNGWDDALDKFDPPDEIEADTEVTSFSIKVPNSARTGQDTGTFRLSKGTPAPSGYVSVLYTPTGKVVGRIQIGDWYTAGLNASISSWVWGGGDSKINVTALPQDQTKSIKVSIDGTSSITANGTYTYTVDYENGDGDDVSTGATKDVTVNIKPTLTGTWNGTKLTVSSNPAASSNYTETFASGFTTYNNGYFITINTSTSEITSARKTYTLMRDGTTINITNPAGTKYANTPSYEIPLTTKTITSNGTYTPGNYVGFNSVVVNNPYALSGYEVYNIEASSTPTNYTKKGSGSGIYYKKGSGSSVDIRIYTYGKVVVDGNAIKTRDTDKSYDYRDYINIAANAVYQDGYTDGKSNADHNITSFGITSPSGLRVENYTNNSNGYVIVSGSGTSAVVRINVKATWKCDGKSKEATNYLKTAPTELYHAAYSAGIAGADGGVITDWDCDSPASYVPSTDGGKWAGHSNNTGYQYSLLSTGPNGNAEICVRMKIYINNKGPYYLGSYLGQGPTALYRRGYSDGVAGATDSVITDWDTTAPEGYNPSTEGGRSEYAAYSNNAGYPYSLASTGSNGVARIAVRIKIQINNHDYYRGCYLGTAPTALYRRGYSDGKGEYTVRTFTCTEIKQSTGNKYYYYFRIEGRYNFSTNTNYNFYRTSWPT